MTEFKCKCEKAIVRQEREPHPMLTDLFNYTINEYCDIIEDTSQSSEYPDIPNNVNIVCIECHQRIHAIYTIKREGK